jgi:hypothetical protein
MVSSTSFLGSRNRLAKSSILLAVWPVLGALLLSATPLRLIANAKSKCIAYDGTRWQCSGLQRVGKDRSEEQFVVDLQPGGSFRVYDDGTDFVGVWEQRGCKVVLTPNENARAEMEGCCLFIDGIIPDITKWSITLKFKVLKDGTVTMKYKWSMKGRANYYFIKTRGFSLSGRGVGSALPPAGADEDR